MATAGVEILIAADDQASAKLAAVTANIEREAAAVEQISAKARTGSRSIDGLADSVENLEAKMISLSEARALGLGTFQADRVMQLRGAFQQHYAAQDMAAAKTQAEQMALAAQKAQHSSMATKAAIGSMALALSGTQFGHVASELMGMKERMDLMKNATGAAGGTALLAKAVFAALAGVIGFQVGKALGNAIFQTERWNRELLKATESAKTATQAMISLEGKRLAGRREDIELIEDPEAKRLEQLKLIQEANDEVLGIERQIAREKSIIAEWDGAINMAGNLMARQAKAELVLDEERHKAAKGRLDTLREEYSEEKLARDAKKLANEEEKKHLEEMKRLQAEDAKARMEEAERFKQENLRAMKEIESEKEQQRQKDRAAAQSIADEVDPTRIVERKRAEIKRLMEQSDLDRKTGQKALDLLQDRRPSQQATQAFEARLLTRGGPGTNPVEKATKDVVAEQKKTNDLLRRYLPVTGPAVRLEFIQ